MYAHKGDRKTPSFWIHVYDPVVDKIKQEEICQQSKANHQILCQNYIILEENKFIVKKFCDIILNTIDLCQRH